MLSGGITLLISLVFGRFWAQLALERHSRFHYNFHWTSSQSTAYVDLKLQRSRAKSWGRNQKLNFSAYPSLLGAFEVRSSPTFHRVGYFLSKQQAVW